VVARKHSCVNSTGGGDDVIPHGRSLLDDRENVVRVVLQTGEFDGCLEAVRVGFR
jgi:hypothetical protein